MLLASLLAGCALAIGASAATASLPIYEGGRFPIIHNPSDPEEFSWEVELRQGQQLMQIDEHEVAVYYEDGTEVWSITATPAHDALGASVPTTIEAVGENVVTLTVHHREGNPAAGGTPFTYPVVEGEAYVMGPSTVIVHDTPNEAELRQQRERVAEAEREAKKAARCHVPALRDASLAGARRRLRRANCRLGAISEIHRATAKTGRVVAQSQPSGSSLPPKAKVGVRLGLGD